MSLIARCTPKMVTEGARALDLWSDESLREEIDGRRMAELVWQAMVPHSDYQEDVVLSDDERKALAWAARKGAHLLRSEGWPDMKRNAEILDGVLPRLERRQ